MAHDPHADAAAHAHAPAVEGDDVPHHGPVLSEPKSPMWLPLLGIALLGIVLVWWLSTPSADEERAAAAAASASASASAAAVASAPPQPTTIVAQPAQPKPGLPPNPGGSIYYPPGGDKVHPVIK